MHLFELVVSVFITCATSELYFHGYSRSAVYSLFFISLCYCLHGFTNLTGVLFPCSKSIFQLVLNYFIYSFTIFFLFFFYSLLCIYILINVFIFIICSFHSFLFIFCNLLGRLFAFIMSFTHVIIYAGTTDPDLAVLLHLPLWLWPIKIPLIALVYLGILWVDCSRNIQIKAAKSLFFAQVFRSILILIPLFPMFAVVIAAGFLLIGFLMQLLQISTDYLNWPIYYGVMYGPFAFIYIDVKRWSAFVPILG
jgi:hypothetical protein